METTPPSAPPVMGANIPPSDSDSDHLTLLAIFYYVMAGLQLLFGGGFGLLYLVIGLVMLSMPESMQGPNDPENIGLIAGGVMAAVGGFVFLLSLLVGTLQIMTGNRLRKARSRTFCMIVAGITCLSVPIGTILGVFTFVVLNRPDIQARFAANQFASPGRGATYR